MDQDVQQWDAFLGEWATIHADHLISAGQLRDELISKEQVYQTLQDAMPDDVAEAVRKDHKASLSLGVILGKHVDQIYPSGRKLCREKDSHNKVSLWKVAGSAENQESQSVDRFAGSAGSSSLRRPLCENQSNLIKCIEVEQLPALPAKCPIDSDYGKSPLPANSCSHDHENDSGIKPTNCPKSERSLICSVCGDKLVVDGKILKGYCQKNGQFYCAQPGCGYPKREEPSS